MKRSYTCYKCHAPGEFEPILTPGFERLNNRPKLCNACADEQERELACRKKQEKQSRLEADWQRICPPNYRLTNPNHPDINREVLSYLLAWKNTGDGRGIALIGETGLCKTRMMYLLAQNLHFSGTWIAAVNARDLCHCWSRSFGDDAEASRSREIVRRCRNAEVLFLDDVGKGKFTDRTEDGFYGLVEYRTSHLKPIHWTANSDGQGLEAMMSADRGGAIVRRLREFSEVPSL